MLKLTHDNYFSHEADKRYMSFSQFKAFERCEYAALFAPKEEKVYFLEGHFFEAVLDGAGTDYIEAHPQMLTTRKELRENFKRVAEGAYRVMKQPVFAEIFNKCEKQVILTGEIAGVPFKGCIDLFDKEALDTFDTKCVKSFDKVWSPVDYMKLDWFLAYGYHYQAAIYRELIRQNFGANGMQHLIAATKEAHPDIGFWQFQDNILDDTMTIIEHYAPIYAEIKAGKREPHRCNECDFCKDTRSILAPELIEEYK